MIGIGRQADYGARIVLHLSGLEPGAQVTAAEIARMRLIPPVLIRRLVSRLSKAGILRTARGSGGGLSLARSPSRISLADVVEAIEGPIALNGCVVSPGACPLAARCPIQRAWVRASRELRVSLRRVRFSQLALRKGPRKRKDRPKSRPPKAGLHPREV
ncbi:MAG: RrF2 family transcriptional regulator [Acidobacteriota bacterium]